MIPPSGLINPGLTVHGQELYWTFYMNKDHIFKIHISCVPWWYKSTYIRILSSVYMSLTVHVEHGNMYLYNMIHVCKYIYIY